MGKIVAFANQKGGVAKTITSWTTAAGLKRRGYKVLAIDLDPQGNLATCTGVEKENIPTVFHVMKGEVKIQEAIQKLDVFDLLPSNMLLSGADAEFDSMKRKEYLIKDALIEVKDEYDYIILDTPPALGILTINAFTCADEIIIPAFASELSLEGIMYLYEAIEAVQKLSNPDLKIRGIVFTRYMSRSVIHKELKNLTKQITDYIGVPIFKSYIRSAVGVETAVTNKKDLYSYDKNSKISKDYERFIDEYLKGEG